MRTVIDVPDEMIRSLDHLSSRGKRSRAALIREALAAYLQQNNLSQAEDAFGLWKNRIPDGVAYQNALRAEWTER